MAQLMMESDIDYLENSDIDDIFDLGEALLLDAERRGIEIWKTDE